MNEVYFPALFPDFALPEELAEALERLAVVHAELDRETRTIRLDAQAEHYLAEKQLQSLCRAVEKQYGLKQLELSVRYPAEELPNMDFRDLAQVFICAFARCSTVLPAMNVRSIFCGTRILTRSARQEEQTSARF